MLVFRYLCNRKLEKYRLKDRVWIYIDKLKYVRKMFYCMFWVFRDSEITFALEDYSRIVGFTLMCY